MGTGCWAQPVWWPWFPPIEWAEKCYGWMPVSFMSGPVSKTFLFHRKQLLKINYTLLVVDFLAATITIVVFVVWFGKIWMRLEKPTANIDTNKKCSCSVPENPGLWYLVTSFYFLALETEHYGITSHETCIKLWKESVSVLESSKSVV